MTSGFFDFEEDGTDPGNPPSSHARVFPRGGRFYGKNAAGAERLLGVPDGTEAGQVLHWDGIAAVFAPLPDEFESLIQGDSDFDDFIAGSTASAIGWAVGTNGSGTTAQIGTDEVSQNHPGVARIDTGTTASGRAAFSTTANVRLGGMPVIVEGMFFIPDLSTALENFRFQFGFGNQGNSATDQTNGVFLEHAGDGLTWKICTFDNASGLKTPTTTPVQSGAWTRLRVEVNAAGTEASFYVNGNLIGTQSSFIPVADGRFVGLVFRVNKTVGIGERAVFCDYVFYSFGPFTVAR